MTSIPKKTKQQTLPFRPAGTTFRPIFRQHTTSDLFTTNPPETKPETQSISKYFGTAQYSKPIHSEENPLTWKDTHRNSTLNEKPLHSSSKCSTKAYFQETTTTEKAFNSKSTDIEPEFWADEAELEKLVSEAEKTLLTEEKKRKWEKSSSWEEEVKEEEQTVSTKVACTSKLVNFSPEQKRALSLAVEQRRSIFFTGSAGTGKSLLLQELIKRMRKKFRRDEVAVTASTGIAACNIGGTTLHSFAGVGLGSNDSDQLLKMVMKQRKTKQRWLGVKVLIIDEISMLDGEFFDKLEYIARRVRASNKPFGGIQLVATGDFFQLPPVSKDSMFCFEAKSWTSCIQNTIHLTQVFRQREQSFVDILNSLRIGILTPESERIFRSLSRVPQFPKDGIEPTRLYALRGEVDAANARKLNSLPGDIHRYLANDAGKPPYVEKLSTNCLASSILELKIHAQVMLIRNLDHQLVNGSLGVVVGFDEENGMPIVRFSSCTITVTPETWKIEVPGLGEVASRTQVPLILAWAMSIHKAQGQTLERVVVDLSRVFEKGQAYVALSRATSLDGLQVLNFDKRKVMAHPKVVQFYRSLLEDEISDPDFM